MSAIAIVLAEMGHHVSAAATSASSRCSIGCAPRGVDVHVGHDRAVVARRATPSPRRAPCRRRNIELRRGRDHRASPCCAAPGCSPRSARMARSRRRRRHARQDHHDVDADADPRRGRLAAELRHRRRRHRRRHRRAVDRRRVVRRRGRRERRHPPRAAAVRHDPHQRRDRPPRPLRHVRRDRRRLRPLPRADRRARRCCAPTIRCAPSWPRAPRRGHLRHVRGRRLPRRRRAPERRRARVRRRAPRRARSAPVDLPLRGIHNVRNAPGRWRWRWSSASTFDDAAAALARFGGVARRFDIRGVDGGATLVDDYAHLPSEIAAVLRGARRAATAGSG